MLLLLIYLTKNESLNVLHTTARNVRQYRHTCLEVEFCF